MATAQKMLLQGSNTGLFPVWSHCFAVLPVNGRSREASQGCETYIRRIQQLTVNILGFHKTQSSAENDGMQQTCWDGSASK